MIMRLYRQWMHRMSRFFPKMIQGFFVFYFISVFSFFLSPGTCRVIGAPGAQIKKGLQLQPFENHRTTAVNISLPESSRSARG
jgi:hypothetical protein